MEEDLYDFSGVTLDLHLLKTELIKSRCPFYK
jgi:hypothetical protein